MGDHEMAAGVINRLNNTGVINNVRARLRSDLVQATIGALQSRKAPKKAPSLDARIADSLELGTDEICEAWRVKGQLRDRLTAPGEVAGPVPSLLVRLVKEMGQLSEYKGSVCHSQTQTELESNESHASHIDAKLSEVDKQLCAQAEKQNLEERMIKFQRECEERCRLETAAEVARVREVEVSRMRLQEVNKSRAQQEKMRDKLEELHTKRLSELREREAELRDRFVEKEKQLERACYDHRQRILQEMEVLRQRERDAEAAERRASNLANAQEESIRARLTDLEAREAGMLGAQQRRESEIGEARALCRQEIRLEYAERLAAVERNEKEFEKATKQAALLEERLNTLQNELADMSRDKLAAEHAQMLASQELAKVQGQSNASSTTMATLEETVTQLQRKAKQDAEEIRTLQDSARQMHLDMERSYEERRIERDAAESRLNVERESRMREAAAHQEEVKLLRDQSQFNMTQEQTRWSNERQQYEKKERQSQHSLLSLKEAYEVEMSAHEMTKARLEEVTMQLQQAEKEAKYNKALYNEARDTIEAGSGWKGWKVLPDKREETKGSSSQGLRAPVLHSLQPSALNIAQQSTSLGNEAWKQEMDQAKHALQKLENEDHTLRSMQGERIERQIQMRADAQAKYQEALDEIEKYDLFGKPAANGLSAEAANQLRSDLESRDALAQEKREHERSVRVKMEMQRRSEAEGKAQEEANRRIRAEAELAAARESEIAAQADADRTLLEYKRLEAIKQEDDKVHEQSEKVKADALSSPAAKAAAARETERTQIAADADATKVQADATHTAMLIAAEETRAKAAADEAARAQAAAEEAARAQAAAEEAARVKVAADEAARVKAAADEAARVKAAADEAARVKAAADEAARVKAAADEAARVKAADEAAKARAAEEAARAKAAADKAAADKAAADEAAKARAAEEAARAKAAADEAARAKAAADEAARVKAAADEASRAKIAAEEAAKAKVAADEASKIAAAKAMEDAKKKEDWSIKNVAPAPAVVSPGGTEQHGADPLDTDEPSDISTDMLDEF